jgi:hypothetical protein
MIPEQERSDRATKLIKRLEELAGTVAASGQAYAENTQALCEQISNLEIMLEQVMQVLVRFQSFIDFMTQTYPPNQAPQARRDIFDFLKNLAELAKKMGE